MNRKEFERRRRQLMRMVGAGGIAILPAAPVRMRSRDVEYRYRQDSDFLLSDRLRGAGGRGSAGPGTAAGRVPAVLPRTRSAKEQWDGSRAGQDGAIADFGADDAFPIDDIDDIIPGLIEGCERVYYTMGMYRISMRALRSGSTRCARVVARRAYAA